MNHGGQRTDCQEFFEALSAYLDGELSAPERSGLEAHLEGCPRCQEELKSLRAVSRLVTSLPEVRASAAFLSALDHGFAVEKRRRWLRPIPLFKGDLVPALAAAAVLLIGVTVALVLPSVRRFRGAVEPYEAVPSLSRPETPAPGAAPEAAGATVETKADRERLPAPAAPPSERGLMELARDKAGPPAPAAPPYKDQASQQAVLAGRKDGGGGAARDELAAATAPASPAPAGEAGETASAPAGPVSNVGVAPGSGGEAWRRPAPLASPTARKDGAANEVTEGVAGKGASQAQLQTGFAQGQRPGGPAFLLVTLRCTDVRAGSADFSAALQEFTRLEGRIPDPASARPMTQEEESRYSQVVRELLEAPDVVTFRETVVPVADIDLVQAVFSDRRAVTFADVGTDTARLRNVLSARRLEVAARPPVAAVRAPEAAPPSTTAGPAVVRAKAAPTQGQLVHVILVLRGQPGAPPRSSKE